MKKSLLLLIIATTSLLSCGQAGKEAPKTGEADTSNSIKNLQNDKNVYNKYVYTDPAGKYVVIENSFPKGGMKYTAPNGNVYSYAVFWTGIANETDNSLELKIDFPANSYEISNFPGKYFTMLVPADTMTPDKIPLSLYGLKDVNPFLDKNTHKPSSLQRTIHPKESSGFYFLMLILTEEATGMTRTGLRLQGKELIYKISRYSVTKPISLIEEKEISCGSINLTNLRLSKLTAPNW